MDPSGDADPVFFLECGLIHRAMMIAPQNSYSTYWHNLKIILSNAYFVIKYLNMI